MTDNITADYKNLYLETAENHLKEFKTNLDLLSQNHINPDAISNIHRAVHSLKGSSLVMGYKDLASLCANLENIFLEIKNGKVVITEALLNSFSNSLVDLEKTLENIKNS